MREADPTKQPTIPTTPRHTTVGTTVFIVHGHDDGARDAVTLFAKKSRSNSNSSSREANEGVSIDRKLEKYSNVGHAIVILTLTKVLVRVPMWFWNWGDSEGP
ncbi:hypothetical protein E6H33_09935 [Candidatus Bathyarchaeota archaeon]|nr:MAG: hypothetical protein E6H33_09935 [Candidatus Bathyarchaeota archaeon]